MKISYINKAAELEALLFSYEERGIFIIAMDIEAESNLHAYGERLCLIQIFDGENAVIVDPLRIEQNIVKALFENRQILKIMYDASSDMSLLKNAMDIEVKSVLDLRPAVEILNYPNKDLHSVIAADLGITLFKKAKFQKFNWISRPIPEEAMEYALNDVTHLFRLKDIMLKRLLETGNMDKYILKNLQVQNKDYLRNPEDKYRKMTGYTRLPPHQQATLRRAFDVREKYAKKLNMPADYIINKRDLVGLVCEPGAIERIRLPVRLGPAIQDMKNELKTALLQG